MDLRMGMVEAVIVLVAGGESGVHFIMLKYVK